MNTNFGIVIQARTGSTRLPHKMVLPFYNNKTLFQIVVENLLQIFPKEKIILATTVSTKDDVLVNISEQLGIKVFRGSEENVLDRFVNAAEKYNLTHLIRVCADNPFLLQKQLGQLREYGEKSSADYLAYFFTNGLPSIKTHSGFFAEWVSLNALKKVAELTTEKVYIEHVTNFIYANPELFTIEKMQVPDEDFCGKVRLTIDTIDDFEMCKMAYEVLLNQKNISIESIKELVLSDSSYLEKMKILIQQQTK